MSHVLILPGDAGSSAVARGLLDIAAGLGLPADVVEWSPSKGGFVVTEAVAAAYAGTQDESEPEPVELEPDGATGPVEAAELPPANATMDIVLPVPIAETPAAPAAPAPVAPLAAAAETSPGQPTYSDEEKAAAVNAVVNQGRSIASVAQELGASATSVGKWVKAANAASVAEGGTP